MRRAFRVSSCVLECLLSASVKARTTDPPQAGGFDTAELREPSELVRTRRRARAWSLKGRAVYVSGIWVDSPVSNYIRLGQEDALTAAREQGRVVTT